MSVPADLLTQARSLATSDPKKPKQAMDAWNKLKVSHPDAVALFAMCVLLWPGLSGR